MSESKILTIDVYLYNSKNQQIWDYNKTNEAFRQYFPTVENNIPINLSVYIPKIKQVKFEDIKETIGRNIEYPGKKDSYVNILCQNALRPGYVQENFDDIKKNGGAFIQCSVTINSGGRNRSSTYPLAFTTCYIRNSDNSYETINNYNDISLYIATICSPSNTPFVTIKGLGSRMLDSIYQLCVLHENFKSVRLDALLYCINPNQLIPTTSNTTTNLTTNATTNTTTTTNARQRYGAKRKIEETTTNIETSDAKRQETDEQTIDVDTCNLWLHDYYMSKGYILLNNHIYNETNELFEYERDAVENKLKKKSSGHKIYKFNTMALVPMIKNIRS